MEHTPIRPRRAPSAEAGAPSAASVPPAPATPPVPFPPACLPSPPAPFAPVAPGPDAAPAAPRPRSDGWTPERQRQFLELYAAGGVVGDAARAVGLSRRAVYALRDRDPLFAAGLGAAGMLARRPLADAAYARARNGVVERLYRNGELVAERHRFDNRLTMAVLARLDAEHDKAVERGDPHLRLAGQWDAFLDTLAADRRAEGLAMLDAPVTPAPATPDDVHTDAGACELCALRGRQAGLASLEEEEDPHRVWEDAEGWWTDYPPPPGFGGEERGVYGAIRYARRLDPAEQAAIDAQVAAEVAEEEAALAAERRAAEAQRARFFADPEDGADEGADDGADGGGKGG